MICIGLHPRVCTQCGKKFESRSEYAYRIPRNNRTDDFWYFCSYKCIRAYEKEKAKKKKPTPRESECLSMLAEGHGTSYVAEKMGVSVQRVRYIRDKWRDRTA